MFDVALAWERCPDGIEICDLGPAPADDAGGPVSAVAKALAGIPEVPSGICFRPRSERRVPMRIDAVDLENPLSLRFVNASTDEDYLSLLGRYGMPSNETVISSKSLRFQSRLLGNLAEVATGENNSRKAEDINLLLLSGMTLTPEFDYSDPAQKGRVALYAGTMLQFMSAEIAIAAINDVRLVRCKNCNNAFFVGPLARRRSDAKTCSDKCRVALLRKGRIMPGSASRH